VRFRWHRSLCFWLGVPGLLFLLWIWILSAMHRTDLSITGPVTVFVANEAGFIRATCWKDPAQPGWSGLKADHMSLHHSARFFPGYAWRVETHSGVLDLWLAHWLGLFSYLVIWGLLLGWRWSKFRACPSPRLPAAR
jgi:hypothetical protein